MPLPPFRTCRSTVDWSGFSSSRFGPTCPFEPAALSVWQPPQPALAKTFAPGALEAAARAAAARERAGELRRGWRLLAR